MNARLLEKRCLFYWANYKPSPVRSVLLLLFSPHVEQLPRPVRGELQQHRQVVAHAADLIFSEYQDCLLYCMQSPHLTTYLSAQRDLALGEDCSGLLELVAVDLELVAEQALDVVLLRVAADKVVRLGAAHAVLSARIL